MIRIWFFIVKSCFPVFPVSSHDCRFGVEKWNGKGDRYYGHYSNKTRGMRTKTEAIEIEDTDNEIISNKIEVIDISKYQPKPDFAG